MEKATYYEQLADLKETFPEKKKISLAQACKYCGSDPRTLLADKTFPAKPNGKRYGVNLINLARWLAS